MGFGCLEIELHAQAGRTGQRKPVALQLKTALEDVGQDGGRREQHLLRSGVGTGQVKMQRSRRAHRSQRIVQQQLNVVRLGHGRDLLDLAQAAGHADIGAYEVYQLRLDRRRKLPLVGPLLAGRQRRVDVPAEGAVAAGMLGADGVLDGEQAQRFDLAAEPDGVGRIETGV